MDFTSLINMGFPQILLWLLTFAIVYGVLSQAGEGGIPKSQGTRAIIALVAAFFVLFSIPNNLIEFISRMSSSLIMVIMGILAFVVFIETAGIKGGKKVIDTGRKDKDGNKIGQEVDVSIFEAYSTMFAIGFLIIAGLIFVSSGGLELIGMPNIQMSDSAIMSYMFLAVVVLAIVWMVADPKK